MFNITVGSYIRHLTNLKNILLKAKDWQKSINVKDEAICNAHLAIDQFPLKRQVQMACDYAKKTGAHLCGIEAPFNEDTENTLDELVMRLDTTLSFLESLYAKDLVEDSALEKKLIPLPWLPGKAITAKYYIEDYALPQFYFHYTTAYSILRNFGLPLGKGDYLGSVDIKDLA